MLEQLSIYKKARIRIAENDSRREDAAGIGSGRAGVDDPLPLEEKERGEVSTGNLQKELWGHYTSGQPQYPRQNENEINLALSEAWVWLQAQGLIVPDMENGQYGWLVLSRRARDAKRGGFQKLQGLRCDRSLSFDCPITIP